MKVECGWGSKSASDDALQCGQEKHMNKISTPVHGVLLIACSALSACGSGTYGANGSQTTNGVTLEVISADASVVKAAAAPTTGKSDVTEHPSGLLGNVQGSSPTRLVVLCHGPHQTVENAWTAHMTPACCISKPW